MRSVFTVFYGSFTFNNKVQQFFVFKFNHQLNPNNQSS